MIRGLLAIAIRLLASIEIPSEGGASVNHNDPLLEPYQLKHLQLKNRIMITSHEPAYPQDGMPKQRYRAYHEERAKAGVGLTMTAGSATVSPWQKLMHQAPAAIKLEAQSVQESRPIQFGRIFKIVLNSCAFGICYQMIKLWGDSYHKMLRKHR